MNTTSDGCGHHFLAAAAAAIVSEVMPFLDVEVHGIIHAVMTIAAILLIRKRRGRRPPAEEGEEGDTDPGESR